MRWRRFTLIVLSYLGFQFKPHRKHDHLHNNLEYLMRDAISEILTNRVFSYTRAHEYTHARIYIVHVIIYHVSRRIYYNILSSMEITFNRYIHNTYFVRTLYLLLQKMICRRLRNNITFAMHACASIKKRNNINRETTTLNRIIMLVVLVGVFIRFPWYRRLR